MKRWISHPKFAARIASLQPMDRWLGTLALACIAVLAVELAAPHPLETPAETGHARSAATDVQPEPWQPRPLEDYRAIAERPLFSFDRKPFVAPPPEPPPAPPAGPRIEFELTAVATSSTARMAFLKTNSSRGIVKLGLNQAIEGWTLVEVRDNAVVLRNGAEERTVKLQSERAREKSVGDAVALDARGRRQR
jgi:hypothetical protein